MKVPAEDEWFWACVREQQARLRAFVRVLGVRSEAVDDFAQDALIVAFEKRDTFGQNGQNDFGAWVRGIARKLVANAVRKDIRRRQLLSDGFTDLLLQVQPDTLHPLLQEGNKDRIGALSECVKALPERSRELVTMRYFEELSPGDIGSRLDRSANDVRQILFRIRRGLLSCVERRLGET
jgi:RNA polymerase sigma-70 factor, ECF subfamily